MKKFTWMMLALCTLACGCSKNEDDENFPNPNESEKNKVHEYVDLGLSVKWATCNVGADSPEDYGDYFARGEITPKSEYTIDNSLTYGIEFGSICGDAKYDAATANWGAPWRLPTAEECQELLDKCAWEWTSRGGHNGYKVIGHNGNSIFLPTAGIRSGAGLYNEGTTGYYWSGTPYESDSGSAYELVFLSGSRGVGWIYRFYGKPVRPVTE